MNNQPIGVFDSGVGGLTVLRQLLVHLPGERMIYLGDTARLPYGTKSPETVVRYSINNAAFLVEKGIKFLVVACNTASALALEALKEHVSVPIVGVIMAGARKAALCTRKGKVGVIGTAATIASRAYETAIRGCTTDTEVFSVACPLFVPLAEEGWTDDEITAAVAERYLAPFRRKGIDVLVLGCTHYPLLKPVLSSVMGEGVTLVDSAEEVALQVEAAVKENGLGVGSGSDDTGPISPKVYLTDSSPHFLELSRKILGFSLAPVETVDVG